MKIVLDSTGKPLAQRTKEWFDYRRGKIGSSHASTIMGVNPFETKLQLWQRMKGLLPEKEITEAMQNGVDQEAEGLQCFEDLLKVAYGSYVPTVFEDKEYPFLIASVDGYSHIFEDFTEIKVSHWIIGQVIKILIPDSCFLIIQHHIM